MASPATFSVVGTEVSLVYVNIVPMINKVWKWENLLGGSLVLDVVLLGVHDGADMDEREMKSTLEVGLF